jgi:pimeloyl-ACP methyl ester carboxylesterase
MGFGKSETPADRTYWLQDHINNMEKLVICLDLKDITLVINDFGGAVGMGLASMHPERITRIVSVNGPTPFGQPDLVSLFEANRDFLHDGLLIQYRERMIQHNS